MNLCIKQYTGSLINKIYYEKQLFIINAYRLLIFLQ